MRRMLLVFPLSIVLAACGVGSASVATDKDRHTPLEKAAQAADVSEVQRLLASGADPNDRGGYFGSPLDAAIRHDHNSDVIRALTTAGANPNGRGEEGKMCWASPLSFAAFVGDIENTSALLESGAAITNSHCSKLIAGWLKPPVIDLLRQYGLDIFKTDSNGLNELHVALAPPFVPSFEGIEYLVSAGVPLNARDHSGKTPLAYWREPRDFETHWFHTWLLERLAPDVLEFPRQRDTRVRVSTLLEHSGAQL